MTNTLGIGIIGCGNISAAYMQLGPLFRGIEVRACADANPEASAARAAEFGLDAVSIDQMLARDDIDIVVNLTVPAAHYDVSNAALDAGKHVYSERPFVLSREEGETLLAKANAKGLRVGSAPDTFLGGSHQMARALVDDGRVGKITSGTAIVQGPGMESWHPNPDFFFVKGGGPVLDMGPYYISNLVQLLGPVKEVMAMTNTPQQNRTIANGARNGEQVPVETPTTIHALLRFASGAQVTMLTSWDVQAQSHGNMEIYGEKGSIFLPDPNFFGGDVRVTEGGADVDVPASDHPFSVPNSDDNTKANYRGAGLADMAQAIHEDRPHRCGAEFAHHVVDVMTSILHSGERRALVEISSTCERPAPLSSAQAQGLMV